MDATADFAVFTPLIQDDLRLPHISATPVPGLVPAPAEAVLPDLVLRRIELAVACWVACILLDRRTFDGQELMHDLRRAVPVPYGRDTSSIIARAV